MRSPVACAAHYRKLVRLIGSFLISFVSRTWVIAGVTVIICAYFLANAASSIIEAEALADSPKSTVPAAAAKAPVITASTKLDGTKITRNIFCSTCEPTAVADAGPARYSGEPAVLIATMLGPDPRATVRVLASEAQGSWGLGERIPGVGMVDRIGSTSIDVVDVAGHRGTISMLDGIPSAEGRPKRSADAATSGDAAAPADPFADRVRKISDTEFEVDRNLVRELVTGTTKPGGVRPIPMMKGNEVTGIRMVGVRTGSVASALGLKSNDILSTIDGDPIKNIQQLLDLYAKLDQVNAVELGGTRGGKPLALTLRLR